MSRNNGKTKKEQSHKVFLSKEFVSDLTRQNMLYAKIVRSPQKNIRISTFNLSILPENYYFFTSRDIPGKNVLETLETKSKIFADGIISYKGEPIGILAGEDRETVEYFAEKLSDSFIQPESDELQDSFKSEILAERNIKTGFFENQTEDSNEKTKDITKTEDDFISVSSEFEYEENFYPWNETSGAFCFYEGQSLTVMSPTKWPYHLKQNLCSVLNLSEENIIIKKTQIQNSNLNGTWRISSLAIQTALASFKTGKPVKLILSKQEQKEFVENKIKIKIAHESKISKENKILSTKIDISADAGLENPYAKEFIDRLTISSVSLYNIENIFVSAKVFTSQNPPTSIYPETVDSAGYIAMENHIQKIAEKTSLLPDEIRKLNIQDFKSKIFSPFNYKIHDKLEILEPILSKSNFKRKYASFSSDSKYLILNKENTFSFLTRRGIGLSFSPDGSGYYGSSKLESKQTMETTLSIDGIFSIHSHLPSPTVSEIWKKTASEILEIDSENIKIINEFPDDEIPDLPENIYSNISVMTQLLRKCCLDIQKKRFKMPLPLHTEKSISSAMKRNWNAEKFIGQPFHTTSFGGAIMEIEMNPLTLSLQISKIWIVIDCGEILSIKAAENAVRLSVQKELLFLLKDHNLFCEEININFIESKTNPSQIGEIVHSLIPSAFINALSQITSTQIKNLPISQEQIFEDLKTAEKIFLEEEKNKTLQEEKIQDRLEQTILEMQEPIKSIINEIEENKLEETDKIEEQEEKAQKLSKADEEAIKYLLNENKNSENNQLKDEK